jgi:hypothetical protein
VRLAFENDGIINKDFKGINVDLLDMARWYDGEFTNATG